jgi:hypothetical protein
MRLGFKAVRLVNGVIAPPKLYQNRIPLRASLRIESCYNFPLQRKLKHTMADSAAPAAPEEQMQNLHLDEVTGERVSKSELKKRQKQRQKEEEKQKKAAAAPPKPAAAKKSNAEADE